MAEVSSPLEDLLDSVRAALAARRRDASARLDRAEAAFAGYRRALEAEIAASFAAAHNLKAPAASGANLTRASAELHEALLQLPELARLFAVGEAQQSALQSGEVSARAKSNDAAVSSKSRAAAALPAALSGTLPLLSAALLEQKLVIVGALASHERGSALPSEVGAASEWIDTARDGAHALGNLPQRIRQGRVAALIVLDRAVKHQHSEPAVAAARDARIPFAFAGQGGRASLERALEQIEGMLRERA